MFCKNCGVYLSEGAIFCPECGTRQDEESVIVDVDSSCVSEENDSIEANFDADQREIQSDEVEVSEQQETSETQEPSMEEKENQHTQIVNSMYSTDKIKYCHSCGAANAEKDAFCYNCGTAFDTVDTKEEKVHSFKWKKQYIFLGIAVLLIGGIIIALAGFVLPKMSKKSTLVYLKDNELNFFQKKEPYVVGDDVFENDENINLPKERVQFSEDGKYVFYPQDYNNDAEYSLYRKKVNDKKTEEIKIDNNVFAYKVLGDEKIIYIKDTEDRKLYVSDMNDKEKIASDVSWFRVSDDKKTVFWYTVDEDNEGTVYMQGIDGKTDKTKIVSGMDTLCDYTTDFKTIVYKKDDNLYILRDYGEKEKIASDCHDTYSDLNNKNTGIYYLVEGEGELGVSDLIDDKYAESDSQMDYPNIKDYQTTTIKDSFWGPMESTITDDAGYQAAVEKYNEKQVRDDIRQMIGLEDSEKIKSEALYYYDIGSGENQKLQDGLYSTWNVFLSVDGIISYYWADYSNVDKISMDKLVDIYQSESNENLENQVEEIFKDTAQFVICEGAKQRNLPIDMEEYKNFKVSGSMIDTDTSTLYVALNNYEEKSSVLLTFDYGNESIEQYVLKDDVEIILLECLCDEGIYYIGGDEDDGTLYLNDERVTDDVENISYAYDDRIIATKDLEDGECTICMVEGNECEKIAEEVADWVCSEDGTVAFLTDYNFNKSRGDLKIYKDGETQNIDSDVSSIVGFY